MKAFTGSVSLSYLDAQKLWGNRCCQCFGLNLCRSHIQRGVQHTFSYTSTHTHTHTHTHMHKNKIMQWNQIHVFTHMWTLSLQDLHLYLFFNISSSLTDDPMEQDDEETNHLIFRISNPHVASNLHMYMPWKTHDCNGTIHMPYLHTCMYTHNAEPLWNSPMSTSMLVATQHYLQLGNLKKPQQIAILEMLFSPNLHTDMDSFPVQTWKRTDGIQMQCSSDSSESTM